MLPLGFAPNITHRVLARWEQEGRLSAVVTQNIDGLHQKAGSQRVYELHGSVLRNYCTRCGKFHTAEFIRDHEGVPKCDCGGTVKPDVVLYDESLDGETLEKSVYAIENADLLIVAGTSLPPLMIPGRIWSSMKVWGIFSHNCKKKEQCRWHCSFGFNRRGYRSRWGRASRPCR